MADNISDLLWQEARRHGISLSEIQAAQFEAYLKLVQQWQRRVVRLVGSDTAGKLVRVHVADAFSVHRCIDEWKGKKLIDIGSGAGFPGICLRIVEPDIRLTLLEASAKKTAFLSKAKAELGLGDVEIVRGRAERIAQEGRFREQFDLATLRAVAKLAKSIETGLPFVRVGGSVVVVRGRSSEDDVRTAGEVGAQMGAGQVVVHSGSVAGAPIRGSVVVLTKTEVEERC